jgi:hypothetical protein
LPLFAFRAASAWADANPSFVPPIGIPAPTFGITQAAPPAPNPWTSEVAGFYYVDPTAPGATDTGRPFGRPGAPRLTIPDGTDSPLPAGSVVELRGTYTRSHGSPNTIISQGTAASPVFIRGASPTDRPTATGIWEIQGTYIIIENIKFTPTASGSGSISFLSSVNQAAMRDCEVQGNLNGGGIGVDSFNSFLNENVVIYRNVIHDNGDVNTCVDQDVHGIKVGPRVSNLWVLDNEMYNNSGDGIQINAGNIGLQATTHHIYVGRNTSHGNKQAGMWIKQATDVIFSENLVYDHRPSDSSSGQAMGYQYATERPWFLFNHMHDNENGIYSGSDSDAGSGIDSFYIGNLIHNIHVSTGQGCANGNFQNGGSAWGDGAAMKFAGGVNRYILNNTIYDTDSGIQGPSTDGFVQIVNNVVSNLSNSLGSHVFFEQPSIASNANSIVRNNLFQGTVRIKWGGSSAQNLTQFMSSFPGQCLGCINADPMLVDPLNEDFRLQEGSPAIDAGTTEAAYTTFTTLYGLDINRDLDGNVRPLGTAFDMGALEGAGPVLPKLSIADATVTEGNSGTVNAVFNVTLSPASADTVTVAFATADQTATTADADYVASSGTLTFTPGQTSRTITVAVNGDLIQELNETFLVNLSTPISAIFQDAQGIGTITSDELPPPAISINDVSATEGNSGTKLFAFGVTLSLASAQTVTVAYATADDTATAGSDYQAASGTLTFAPGSTTQTINVTVNGDTTIEPDETFFVNLSSPTGGATIADAQAIGTILDDDNTPTIVADPSVVGPGASVQVVASGGPGNTGDRVILSAAGAGTAGGITFQYLNGSSTTPPATGLTGATLTFTMPTTPGTYEFLFNLAGTGTVLATSNVVTVDESSNPVLSYTPTSLDFGSVQVGQLSDLTVNITNTGSGLLSGQPITSGTGFTAGGPETAYNLGAGQSYLLTVRFTPPSAGSFTGSVTLTGGEGGTVPLTGTGFVGPSVTPSTSTAIPNQTVQVTVAGGPANPTDFVGLLRTIDPDPVLTTWQYLNGTQSAPAGGSSSALLNFTMPATPGTYDFRFFANDNTGQKLATSVPVSVQAASLGIDDVSVTEGNSGTTNAVFSVTLSPTSTQTVTVGYSTANGTATAGSDYTSTSGTLTFAPGVATQTINVPVIGDTSAESSETFNVNLSGAVNATIADGTGLGTINDNDGSASSLSIADLSVAEGNSGTANATFTVTLSPASAQTVTVGYSTANGTASGGNDYVTTSGTLTFTPGQTSRTLVVLVNGDTLDEANETFVVNLGSPTNASLADGSATGTITDDDATPTLSIGDVTITEGNSGTSNAVFTVSLSAPSGQTVTVAYATANGTTSSSDYIATSGTLTFAPGTPTGTVTVPVTGDLQDEANETFLVNLSGAVNATIADAQAVGTITDNDAPPSITIGDVTVTEGNSGTVSAVFTVTLSPTSGQTVTVAYSTSPAGGTATAGSDYVGTSGTLTFAPGSVTQTLTVVVNGDTTPEANETFIVTLSGAVNGTITDSQGQGTINDDDGLPSLSINDVSVTEGNSGTTNAVFTVTLSAASGQTVSVAFATAAGTASSGADYLANSGSLTFAPGAITQTVSVVVNGDTLDEVNETFLVNLSGPTNATIADAQGQGTITDDDATPSLSIGDVTVAVEGNSGTTNAVFTVTLSAASGQTVTVGFATANGTASSGTDYVASSGTLTFAPGATTQSVTVVVDGDVLDEPNETFLVNLSGPTNATIADAQGQGTITDDDATPSLSIGDVTLAEGNTGQSNAIFLVALSVASGQTVTVAFATADGTATAPGDYTSTSGTLTFAPGVLVQTVTVPVNGDTILEPNETFFVNLSAPVNATIADGQGQATANDDDAPPTALTIDDVTIAEGNSGTTGAVFTVTLSPSVAQTVTVSFATANGTASAGSDYVAASGTLTFLPGATTQTVTVSVNGDALNEPSETFFVNLSASVGASIADPQGLGTISDDDALPSVSIADVTLGEGNSGTTSAVFPLTLSAASGQTVTVNFGATNGTASAGSDYIAGPGTVTFAPGATSATLSVLVIGDTLDEADETFLVNLSGATNATIADNQAVGTITDDDPTPSLSIADAAVAEGNSGTTSMVFSVVLSAASGQTVTVGFSTADGSATTASGDYVGISSGSLTFAPGTTTQALTVLVNGDTVDEPSETFLVNLTAPVNATLADGQAQGTITNEDGQVGPLIVSTLSASPGQTVTVTVNGSPGNPTDWVGLYTTPGNSLLSWVYLNGTQSPPPVGSTSATLTFVLPVTPGTYNFRLFPNDTFTAIATSATVTVNAVPAISVSPGSVAFGSVSSGQTLDRTVTVSNIGVGTLSGTAAAAPPFSVVGTATYSLSAGQSFTVTVRFAPLGQGAFSGNLTLTGAGTVLVPLTGTGAAPGSTTGPTVSVDTASPLPGQAVNVTVTGAPGNPGDWVGLHFTSSPDFSYVSWRYLNGTQSLPAVGATSATFSFPMPTTPGSYNLRLFPENNFTSLATSPTLTISSVPVISVSPGSVPFGSVPLGQSIDRTVTVSNVGAGTLSGAASTGPPFGVVGTSTYSLQPGQSTSITVRYSPSVVGTANGSLTLTDGGGATVPLSGTGIVNPLSPSTTSTLPNEVIQVTVTGGPGNPTDWVGLHVASAPDTSYLAWQYLNGTQTPPASGLTSATLTFQMPAVPGSYNFRMFPNGQFSSIATSSTVVVQSPGGPPTLDPVPGGAVTVGDTVTLSGTNFSAGTVIKFFVNTGSSIDDVSGSGGFVPTAFTSSTLTWSVPATIPLGQGSGSLFVVNTDQGFTTSNTVCTLIFGSAAANIPTITGVNGTPLGACDPGAPVAHADTVIAAGSTVTISGTGFNSPGVNLFGVDLLNPGQIKNYGPLFPLPGATATSFQIEIPADLAAGSASFQVVNSPYAGNVQSNSVSVVAVAQVTISSVSVAGGEVTILGTGFSPLSVINLFALQGGAVVNFGGLNGSTPNIPLTFVDSTELRFTRPGGAEAGAAFVEVLNPPYISFSSSGNDVDGSFSFP